MRLIAILSVFLLTLAGCAHYPGGIAPSTIPLAPGGYTVVKDKVAGRDCLVSLFGIIPITGGNNTAAAIQSALSRTPGATALVGVTSDSVSQFWILWSSTCTQVRGTAVSVP